MLTKEDARQCEGPVDHPALHAVVRSGLQTFMNSMAEAGFNLPLDISLFDAHGDLLRDFVMERNGRAVNGKSDDANALFVFPLVAIARDPSGRTAILHIHARGIERDAITSETKIEYVN